MENGQAQYRNQEQEARKNGAQRWAMEAIATKDSILAGNGRRNKAGINRGRSRDSARFSSL